MPLSEPQIAQVLHLLACFAVTPLRFFARFNPVLGAFAKLRKATMSFVMPVRLCVRIEQLGAHLTDFHEIEYFIRKSVEKIQVSLKSDKNNV
jgi:hypothetical protein